MNLYDAFECVFIYACLHLSSLNSIYMLVWCMLVLTLKFGKFTLERKESADGVHTWYFGWLLKQIGRLPCSVQYILKEAKIGSCADVKLRSMNPV